LKKPNSSHIHTHTHIYKAADSRLSRCYTVCEISWDQSAFIFRIEQSKRDTEPCCYFTPLTTTTTTTATTTTTTTTTTQCYIPDNLNLQQYCCEKLQYCTHANGWQNFQWFRMCVSTGQNWNATPPFIWGRKYL